MKTTTRIRLTADDALLACRELGLSYSPDLRQPDGLWTARCPVCPLHADGQPLTIREPARGRPVSLTCKTGCSPDEIARILSGAVAEPPPSEGPTVEDERGKTVDAFDLAREELKLDGEDGRPTLVRVTKSSDEAALYTVTWRATDEACGPTGLERHYTVGGTAKLRSPVALSDLVAEATDDYPTFTPTVAKIIGSALRKIADLQDDGASPLEQVRGWLAAFLDGNLDKLDYSTEEGRKEAVQGVNAFRGQNRIWINAQAFDHTIRVMHKVSDGTLSYPELCARLRALGFTRKAATAKRADGQQRQRKYWVSPEGYDPSDGDPADLTDDDGGDS